MGKIRSLWEPKGAYSFMDTQQQHTVTNVLIHKHCLHNIKGITVLQMSHDASTPHAAPFVGPELEK